MPTALMWSDLVYRALTAVGGMPLAGALVVYIALIGSGCYVVLRAINPSFRVTTGVDWDRSLLFRTYMHTAPLIKVIVTSVPAFVAGFAVWSLVRLAVPMDSAHPALAGAVFGAVAWIMLSRDGIIGDCDSGNYQLPSLRRSGDMALRGALFGLSVIAIVAALLTIQPERLLQLAAAMGGLGERAWRPVAVIWLLSGAMGGMWIVGIALILARPTDSFTRAWHHAVAAGVLAATCVIILAAWLPRYVRERYDYDLPAGRRIRPVWWKVTDEPPLVRADTWLAVADQDNAMPVRPIRRYGMSGVELTDQAVARIARHLERRGYRTALIGEGAMALYDHACIELDGPRRLAVAAAVVRRTGDPTFARTFMEDLFMHSGTRAAHDLLSMFGDPRVYSYPTDDARLPVGDLYARHGDTTAARTWYRLAGLPEQRAIERAGRVVTAAKSEIIGRVESADPDVEVRVALLPAMSGLRRPDGRDGLPAPPLSPGHLREVMRSAEPSSSGGFALTEVPRGSFRLALRLRSRSGADLSSVRISWPPDASTTVECDGLSSRNVGTISVASGKRSSAR